jgi:hypothetical protein
MMLMIIMIMIIIIRTFRLGMNLDKIILQTDEIAKVTA